MMKFPFEAQPDEVLAAPESFVDAVFSSLASEFLIMPKGEGFLDYPAFARCQRNANAPAKAVMR